MNSNSDSGSGSHSSYFNELVRALRRQLPKGTDYWEHPVTDEPQLIVFDEVALEDVGRDVYVRIGFTDHQSGRRYAIRFLVSPENAAQLPPERAATGIALAVDEIIEASPGLPLSEPGVVHWLQPR